MITAIARNADLQRLGAIPTITTNLILRHQGVHAWSVTLDAYHAKAALLSAGGGLIFEDDETGEVLMSGPSRVFTETATNDEPGTLLQVTGVSDEYYLATRLCFPTPANLVTAQTVTDVYTISAPAETVCKTLVNLNVGPGARVERRVPNLTIAPDLGRGSVFPSETRFDSVLDEVSKACRTAGPMGFRVLQIGDGLVFDVYVPEDRSDEIIFSRRVGNLRGYTFDITAPDATWVAVAGQGEGTARQFVERENAEAAAEWATRVEVFVDRRDTSDTATLEAAGDNTLIEKGASAGVALAPTDTPNMKFAVDYYLGDSVRCEMRGGGQIIDEVSQVTIEQKEEGTFVTPSVGPPNAPRNAPRILQQSSENARRIGYLERRK